VAARLDEYLTGGVDNPHQGSAHRSRICLSLASEEFAVNRLLVMTVLSLTAALLVTAPAGAAGIGKSSTSSKVSPKRDKKKSYRFKVTGTVKFPSALCAPNAIRSNCIPLRCAAGVRDAKYCSRPTIAQVCSGKVKITYKRGTKTVATKTANLKTSCKYTASTTIKKKAKLKVSVRFAGNTILAASKASTKSARAG